MRLPQPFTHGQAADLHPYSGVRPQPIQSYAGQTLQYGTSLAWHGVISLAVCDR